MTETHRGFEPLLPVPATTGKTFPAGKVSDPGGQSAPTIDLLPLDLIQTTKLIRDRMKGPDPELADLKTSIAALGLSNPIRVEARADGRFELIQGYRRLAATRALLADTGDTVRFGSIPAVIAQPGEGLEALYRQMVDENLVRKDISLAEMAMLALDYARDPGTATNDPDKAVAVLFKSTSYQRRSYIRAFLPVVDRLGPDLLFPQDIPRALGLTLAAKLAEVEGLAPLIRAKLKGWDTRTVADELAILRRFAGEDDEAPKPAKPGARPERPTTAMASFPILRPEGRCTCIATLGKLEVQLDRDFTTIDRQRLEQAVRLMLDRLDG